MRSRATPHRGSAPHARARREAHIVTLPAPDPWTDRDFAFHARESLRRHAYVPSAEAKRERDGGDGEVGGSTRGWKAVGRVAQRSEAILPETPELREPDRGHADTSLRDEVAHRIVSQAGDAGLDVTVVVREGIVTLEGPVPERVTREMLQAIVEACPRVRGVDNRLRVDWMGGGPSAARSAGAYAQPGMDHLESTRGAPTTTAKRTG